MRRGPAVWLLVLSVPFLAGCAGQVGTDGPDVIVDLSDPQLFATERPVASLTVWHEELHEETPDPMDDGLVLTMENEWEPRDVELTYHGVQAIFDEWGRAVAAHVYRYSPMEFIVTDFDFAGPSDVVYITARWEPAYYEYAFDAADGRFLGYLDIDHKVRGFTDGRWREPTAFGYEEDLMYGIAYRALGGDLAKPMPGPLGEVMFNQSTMRPLPGECQPYEMEFTPWPWYQAWIDEMSGGWPDPEEVAPKDEQHELVCFRDDGGPLWVFYGNETDYLALTQVESGPEPPQLMGEPLPALTYERRAGDSIPLLLGLAPPVEGPPSAGPGDWADQVRPVLAGVGTNLDYVEYASSRPPIFMTMMHKADPFTGRPWLPIPIPPVLPTPSVLRFEWTTDFWLSDGESLYMTEVDSTYGGPEDPDLHLSERGFSFDDWPADRAQLVPSGFFQQGLQDLIPEQPAVLDYHGWSSRFYDDLPKEYRDILQPYWNSWEAYEFCWEERAGGRFASLSAFSAQLFALAEQESHDDGCTPGVNWEDYDRPFLRTHTPDGTTMKILGSSGEHDLFITSGGEVQVALPGAPPRTVGTLPPALAARLR